MTIIDCCTCPHVDGDRIKVDDGSGCPVHGIAPDAIIVPSSTFVEMALQSERPPPNDPPRTTVATAEEPQPTNRELVDMLLQRLDAMTDTGRPVPGILANLRRQLRYFDGGPYAPLVEAWLNWSPDYDR